MDNFHIAHSLKLFAFLVDYMEKPCTILLLIKKSFVSSIKAKSLQLNLSFQVQNLAGIHLNIDIPKWLHILHLDRLNSFAGKKAIFLVLLIQYHHAAEL